MRRASLALPASALVLLFIIGPAAADPPTPVWEPIPGVNDLSDVAGCLIGQPAGTRASTWFQESDEYYYTLVDLTDCHQCQDGANTITLYWRLEWPTTCHLFMRAWVIRALDAGTNCPKPDAGTTSHDPTPAETLCGPSPSFAFTGSGLVDNSVTLPACPCLDGPAFIVFKIVGTQDCPRIGIQLASPRIVIDGTPDPCISYYRNGLVPSAGAPLDLTGPTAFPGNPSIWLQQDAITPAIPTTWGRVKAIYR